MIERLNIEIKPTSFAGTQAKELKIKIDCTGKPPVYKTRICEPDELISYFDQIWDCAKKEILKILKEK